MGYTVEKMQIKECQGLWGNYPPSKEELQERELLSQRIEDMLMITERYYEQNKQADGSKVEQAIPKEPL